jgi:hypothetical protein
MPKYQLHRLPEGGGDLHPVEMVLFNDTAAMRRAMTDEFPDGCDVWQGQRFVGRFHRAAPSSAQAAEAGEVDALPAVVRQ